MGKIIRIYVECLRDFFMAFSSFDYFIENGIALEVCTLGKEIGFGTYEKISYICPCVDEKIDDLNNEKVEGWPEFRTDCEYDLIVDARWVTPRGNKIEGEYLTSTFPRELYDVMKLKNVKSVGIFNYYNPESVDKVMETLKGKVKGLYSIGNTMGVCNLLSEIRDQNFLTGILKRRGKQFRNADVQEPQRHTIVENKKVHIFGMYTADDAKAAKAFVEQLKGLGLSTFIVDDQVSTKALDLLKLNDQSQKIY